MSGDRTQAEASAPTSDLMRPGLRVGGDGRYELLSKLGEGGMGSVWRAKDLKLTREVAIKRIRGATSPALQERFLRETRALTGLSHPNVVTVFDAGEDSYGNYLVMELVSGKTLAQRLKEGPIEASQAVDLFCAMCRGMSHAHKRGVIHRDLKPSNVMLNDDGVARILDFGLVRLEGSGDLSLTGVGMGTIDYASPEQKQDASSADERSDVFALGLVFYEMLTGKRPAPLQVHKVAQPWRDVIAKATEPEPHERHASMDELLAETERARAAVSHEAAISQAMGKDDDLRCPSCGLLNVLEARFCRSCSTSLQVACPACDASIRTGLRRCDRCGADVRVMGAIRQGIAAALPLMADGEFDSAEAVLRPLLRETLEGPVGGGERHVREVERLLARCRAGEEGQEGAPSRRSAGRRRGSGAGGRPSSPSPLALLLSAAGLVVVVVLALAARGGGSRSESQSTVGVLDPEPQRELSPRRSVPEGRSAPEKSPTPVRRDGAPTPDGGAVRSPQPIEPSPRPRDANGGDQSRKDATTDGSKPQEVRVPEFSAPPAEDKKDTPTPIPNDADRIVAEWVGGVPDEARRTALLSALEAILFGEQKPSWVDAMRQALITGTSSDIVPDAIAGLEKFALESLATGRPPVRHLLPWLESVLATAQPSVLVRWAGLKGWIEFDLPQSVGRVADVARSLAATCAQIQKDGDAKKALAPVLKVEPILLKALTRELEVAQFLAWAMPRLEGIVAPGPDEGPRWLPRQLTDYAEFVYRRYWGPQGSGVKADVLLAAKIWVAVDPEDRVAKLVWAMAIKSVPLGTDAEVQQAHQAVREVAPWFAEQDLQQQTSVVVQRLQRMRVLEVCGSLEVELQRLVETYSKQAPDDVGMAFPDREVISRRIDGCDKEIRGFQEDIDENRRKAERSGPVNALAFESRYKSLAKEVEIRRFRLRRWDEAKRRL